MGFGKNEGMSIHANTFSEKYSERTAKLAEGFRELNISSGEHATVFTDMKYALEDEGFSIGTTSGVTGVFYNNSLLCRSEQFSRVMDLLLESKPIELLNEHDDANMCVMATGDGFRTAMSEGFSGKDVDAVVKVVITFKGEHLTTQETIPRESELWKTKPATAQVSLVGKGTIVPDDIEMLSFRYPIKFFPEDLLTESEKELKDDDQIHFIVRHYLPDNKKTVH